MEKPEHKHIIIRAEVNDPPQKNDGESLVLWIKHLIDKIGMKLLHGPHFAYVDVEGNKGLTAVAIIETSHIAVHVWEEAFPALMQLDVYTCGPFDPQIVFNFLKAFSPVSVEWKYIDREFDLKTLDVGSWSDESNKQLNLFNNRKT
jgi:S-adenosylmethionine/arginine decarboxylase-like enzyme